MSGEWLLCPKIDENVYVIINMIKQDFMVIVLFLFDKMYRFQPMILKQNLL